MQRDQRARSNPHRPPGVDQEASPHRDKQGGRADTVWCFASHAEHVTTRVAARQQLRRLRRGARMQVHEMWGHPRRLRHGKGLPPGVEHSKSVKTKKQRAGWVGNKSQLSQHGTRLRLAAPGNPAPPTGDPQGGGHGSPASTPDAEPKAVGFPSGPSTTRAAAPKS